MRGLAFYATVTEKTPAMTDTGKMAEDRPQVLVVEDELAIRRGLCDVLAYHGYAATGVEDGEAGLREGLRNCYALVILDVMLPLRDGFDVCGQLRERLPHLPILMLTARGSEADVLGGFKAGADDYVTKPFSVAELVARARALLRRAGRLPRADAITFTFRDWHVDPASLRMQRGESHVDLTAREVAILALLARERGRIVSRRVLLAEVWGSPNPDGVETRSVDMQIVKLRKKLATERGAAEPIETVRGAGYRFVG
jgi:DNA-binding response OmpR family regulator